MGFSINPHLSHFNKIQIYKHIFHSTPKPQTRTSTPIYPVTTKPQLYEKLMSMVSLKCHFSPDRNGNPAARHERGVGVESRHGCSIGAGCLCSKKIILGYHKSSFWAMRWCNGVNLLTLGGDFEGNDWADYGCFQD